MYEDMPKLGRNDTCWCGSGRKYKKCHHAFDLKMEELYEQGYELPWHDTLKGPQDIEAIKRSAEINRGVLDYVAERIGPGVSTEQIDRWV